MSISAELWDAVSNGRANLSLIEVIKQFSANRVEVFHGLDRL